MEEQKWTEMTARFNRTKRNCSENVKTELTKTGGQNQILPKSYTGPRTLSTASQESIRYQSGLESWPLVSGRQDSQNAYILWGYLAKIIPDFSPLCFHSESDGVFSFICWFVFLSTLKDFGNVRYKALLWLHFQDFLTQHSYSFS